MTIEYDYLLRKLNISKGKSSIISDVHVTSDGQWIVSSHWDGKIRVWSLRVRKCLRVLDTRSNFICRSALTPDGKFVISISLDKNLRLWDINSGQCLKLLQDNIGDISPLTITPDGKKVIVSSVNSLVVVDILSGNRLIEIPFEETIIFALTVTPDSQYIVSCSKDRAIRIWEIGSGKCIALLKGHSDIVDSIKVTTDGREIISGSRDKTVRIWDMRTRECKAVLEHAESVTCLSLKTDNQIIVVCFKTMIVWAKDSLRCLAKTKEYNTDTLLKVATIPNSEVIVSGSWSGQVAFWELLPKEKKEKEPAEIDNESKELVLLGQVFAIAGEAGQIFRPTSNSDWGIDGEIEFKNEWGEASGKRIYLQLKSGNSYLRKRKRDGKEIFRVKKNRHIEYWRSQAYPVMLVIRTSDNIRWMDITNCSIELANKEALIHFNAEPFTVQNLLKVRNKIFGENDNKLNDHLS